MESQEYWNSALRAKLQQIQNFKNMEYSYTSL